MARPKEALNKKSTTKSPRKPKSDKGPKSTKTKIAPDSDLVDSLIGNTLSEIKYGPVSIPHAITTSIPDGQPMILVFYYHPEMLTTKGYEWLDNARTAVDTKAMINLYKYKNGLICYFLPNEDTPMNSIKLECLSPTIRKKKEFSDIKNMLDTLKIKTDNYIHNTIKKEKSV